MIPCLQIKDDQPKFLQNSIHSYPLCGWLFLDFRIQRTKLPIIEKHIQSLFYFGVCDYLLETKLAKEDEADEVSKITGTVNLTSKQCLTSKNPDELSWE